MSIKTLVIHPQDPSTDFLSEIYAGKDWTIIRENYTSFQLEELIKQHDRIIMMGHGMPLGLLGHGRLIINSTFVPLLKEKQNNVHIWCNANKFVEEHGLKGFTTGMIISEWLEAVFCGILPKNINQIEESNRKFARIIAKSIDLEANLICENVKKEYTTDDNNYNPIIEYNMENIFNY